jgi:hypothetical protein
MNTGVHPIKKVTCKQTKNKTKQKTPAILEISVKLFRSGSPSFINYYTPRKQSLGGI